MPNFEAHVDIKATPAQVRSILLDFPRLKEWNNTIPSIDVLQSPDNSGNPIPGSKLKCHVTSLGSDIEPIVVSNSEEEFSWKGVLMTDFIFAGIHYFRFEKINESTTRFYHGEDFSGLLFGPYRYFTGDDSILKTYQDLADAMKKRAEELFPQNKE